MISRDYLAALALLNPEVDAGILGIVRTVPENLLGSLVLAVAINSEPGVAVVGEVTVLIDAEASGAGTVGDGTGVRTGQTDGGDFVLDDVQALESSGGLGLGGERNGAVVTAGTD